MNFDDLAQFIVYLIIDSMHIQFITGTSTFKIQYEV